MRRFLHIAAFIVLLLAGQPLRAQREFAVSTNAVEWLVKGGANAGAHLSFSRHWSADAEGLYRLAGRRGEHSGIREGSFYVGARWWPWGSFSGFYFGAGGMYDRMLDYYGSVYEDTSRTGLSLRVGYDILLLRHLNLELGIGAWGGRQYRLRDIAELTTESSWFIAPDGIRAALVYIF